MKVKIINNSENPLPKYETEGSAGMDIRANIPNIGESIVIPPRGRALIPTGLHIELPIGYECQIRPRSGLAYKKGITIINTPATIDSDYRGEMGVVLINTSDKPFTVTHAMRIAQMVIAKYERVELEQTDKLSHTERGSGGFGSTGKA